MWHGPQIFDCQNLFRRPFGRVPSVRGPCCTSKVRWRNSTDHQHQLVTYLSCAKYTLTAARFVNIPSPNVPLIYKKPHVFAYTFKGIYGFPHVGLSSPFLPSNVVGNSTTLGLPPYLPAGCMMTRSHHISSTISSSSSMGPPSLLSIYSSPSLPNLARLAGESTSFWMPSRMRISV